MSSRTTLESLLTAEGLRATSWSNGPRDRYAAHRHDYDKVLVAAEGSIVFTLVELGREVRLAAGDRLDLPAGIQHGALVGPDGVVCVEAHLDAGQLPGEPRLRPGWSSDLPSQTDRAGTA